MPPFRSGLRLTFLVAVVLGGAPSGMARTVAPRDGFAGSARCGQCHKKQYEGWRKDWHARALAAPTPETVVGRFSPAVRFEQGATRAETYREGEGYLMKAVDAAGAFRPFPIDWVVGGRRMQDFLTTLPDGRLQTLPIYFHQTSGRWVDYTTLKQGELSKDHPFFWTNYARAFNKECLACHVTGPSIGFSDRTGTFDTTWTDPGVACESCHGPGAAHSQDGEPSSIVRPTALAGPRSDAICASCHAPRAPWRSAFSAAARFRPGQAFDEVFEPLTPVLGADDLSADFWLDGRPSAGSMESAALAQSLCVRKGGMTCFTCHTAPHGGGGLSELKPIARTDAVCLTCHGKLAAPAAARAHTFHAPGTPGSRCADCHLPKLVVGVLDPETDHSLDLPNPENNRDFGIPDACTACHAGKTPAWAVAELKKRWPTSRRRARRRRLAQATVWWRDLRPEAEAALAAILNDPSEAELMRASAATALGSVVRSSETTAPPPAVKALVAALGDRSLVVAARAARSLGSRRERTAKDALAKAAEGRDGVALSAALALLDLADPRAVERTRALAERPTLRGDYRLETALALVEGKSGNLEGARERLERAIADRPDFVKARELLAPLYERLGKPELAGRERERAQALRHDVKVGPAH